MFLSILIRKNMAVLINKVQKILIININKYIIQFNYSTKLKKVNIF